MTTTTDRTTEQTEQTTGRPAAGPQLRSVAQRLLDSSRELSYDPTVEVDWETPLNRADHGASPEWSTLYGTAFWAEMTEEQRTELTRQESACVASTGIWFELILQQMMIRDIYAMDRTSAEFQWALTEIADECRHSIMFARGAEKLGAPAYLPPRFTMEMGRFFKTIANGEAAYAAILVAEEVLDVMQRDWMRGEQVLPIVRTTSKIHVVEESRHMKFARAEMRDRIAGAGRARRATSALTIAIAAEIIVSNMVNDEVYARAGLDPVRAGAEARANEHHHTLMRSSCAHLMEFLDELGLLTRPAQRLYRRVHML